MYLHLVQTFHCDNYFRAAGDEGLCFIECVGSHARIGAAVFRGSSEGHTHCYSSNFLIIADFFFSLTECWKSCATQKLWNKAAFYVLFPVVYFTFLLTVTSFVWAIFTSKRWNRHKNKYSSTQFFFNVKTFDEDILPIHPLLHFWSLTTGTTFLFLKMWLRWCLQIMIFSIHWSGLQLNVKQLRWQSAPLILRPWFLTGKWWNISLQVGNELQPYTEE